MNTFEVTLDYETSARAGADGMFQIISIKYNEGDDKTDLFDQGVHYSDVDDLKSDMARILKIEKDSIKFIED